MRLYFLIIIISLFAACNGATNNSNVKSNVNKTNTSNAVPVYTYEIVNTYPHDGRAFTQGLIFYNGFLYEGTGGDRDRGDDFYSSVRKVELETGKVLQKYALSNGYFGEGITILGDKIYEITWKERTCFVYDMDFKKLNEFTYAGEGWGLTHDGTNLIMSDGTHVIRVLNPENFQTVRTIVVLDENGKPVTQLNELEYIKGEIWANIWQTGVIVRIDPASGKILGRIDLDQLDKDQRKNDDNADVLNGIAYDAATERIFITGKLWKKVFEIKVKPKQ
jgi:glutamine cyclotransferase